MEKADRRDGKALIHGKLNNSTPGMEPMAEQQPTHREIITRVDGLANLLAQHERESHDYRAEVRDAFKQVAGSIRDLAETVERIEDKVLAYDRMRDRIMGSVAAGGVLIGAIWWLVKDKIAHFFGVAS
mgnify:FL=1